MNMDGMHERVMTSIYTSCDTSATDTDSAPTSYTLGSLQVLLLVGAVHASAENRTCMTLLHTSVGNSTTARQCSI